MQTNPKPCYAGPDDVLLSSTVPAPPPARTVYSITFKAFWFWPLYPTHDWKHSSGWSHECLMSGNCHLPPSAWFVPSGDGQAEWGLDSRDMEINTLGNYCERRWSVWMGGSHLPRQASQPCDGKAATRHEMEVLHFLSGRLLFQSRVTLSFMFFSHTKVFINFIGWTHYLGFFFLFFFFFLLEKFSYNVLKVVESFTDNYTNSYIKTFIHKYTCTHTRVRSFSEVLSDQFLPNCGWSEEERWTYWNFGQHTDPS